ncbi:hypothetical protein C0J52_16251 [Blattella germanica]|nr:hypothetical protein C0J52_16251 [Blattella germanica]
MQEEIYKTLQNTELNDIYGKPDIIRKIKSHRLRWKPDGKRPVGRPIMKWENDINYDLREDKDVWRAYVRMAMDLRVR